MGKALILILSVLLFMTGCEVQNPERLPVNNNQEVNKEILKKYFKNQYDYWFATSGNTPLIVGDCPKVQLKDKYLIVDFKFSEKVDIQNIAVLNVLIFKKELVQEHSVWKAFGDYYFMPDQINSVRIYNNLPKGDYKLWYGFYLQEDSLQKYPKLHKNICIYSLE